MNLKDVKIKYYRWRYDRLMNEAKEARKVAFEKDPKTLWKENAEWLSPRKQKQLEDYGYKWWDLKQRRVLDFEDVTEKVRFDSNFTPRDIGKFLKRQAVENHDVDSFWYPDDDSQPRQPVEDTHTDVTWAYCQKGHMHEYNNGQLVYNRSVKETKHITLVGNWKPATVARHLFGLRDKTVVPVKECA